MGLSSLATVGLTFAQNQATQQNAKGQANAVIQQGEIEANNMARKTDLTAATQTNRFLSSGLQLVGTPQADAAGTYATGAQDVNQIISNANQQSKNIYSSARTTMINNIAKSAKGLGLGGLDLSPSSSFLDKNLTAGQLSYLPDSTLFQMNKDGFGADAYTALDLSDQRAGS